MGRSILAHGQISSQQGHVRVGYPALLRAGLMVPHSIQDVNYIKKQVHIYSVAKVINSSYKEEMLMLKKMVKKMTGIFLVSSMIIAGISTANCQVVSAAEHTASVMEIELNKEYKLQYYNASNIYGFYVEGYEETYDIHVVIPPTEDDNSNYSVSLYDGGWNPVFIDIPISGLKYDLNIKTVLDRGKHYIEIRRLSRTTEGDHEYSLEVCSKNKKTSKKQNSSKNKNEGDSGGDIFPPSTYQVIFMENESKETERYVELDEDYYKVIPVIVLYSDNTDFKWKSDNKNVVYVSKSGVMTAQNPGVTDVRMMDLKGHTLITYHVTVYPKRAPFPKLYKNNKRGISVSIKEDDEEDDGKTSRYGLQLQYYTSNKQYNSFWDNIHYGKKVDFEKGKSLLDLKLEDDSVVYVRVRYYVNFNNTRLYGEWSDITNIVV